MASASTGQVRCALAFKSFSWFQKFWFQKFWFEKLLNPDSGKPSLVDRRRSLRPGYRVRAIVIAIGAG
jgi:hypothetical protein